MAEEYGIERLLALRKLTRAVADHLRAQVRDYVTTLTPLLRARGVLGDYVQGTGREALLAADRAFKELEAVYAAAAGARPFNLPRELKPPIELATATLEIAPLEYSHEARGERETKKIVVTSPLKWVLRHAGFATPRSTDPRDLERFLLHHCVLHTVISKQAGVARVLEGLRFPVCTVRLPEFGEMPLTCLCSPVATVRPPDEVLIASTELSGTDTFEEVVDMEALAGLGDPLREALLELTHGG